MDYNNGMVLAFLIGSWLSLQSDNTRTILCDVFENGYENTRIEFTIPGFYLDTVMINNTNYSKVSIPGTVDYLQKGYPQLPRIAKSLIIPDDKDMKLRIVHEEVERVRALPVMPSKGNIYRDVLPSSVPYTFSDFYSSDEIFPAELVTLSNPFIIRDFRGITVYVNPVRYDNNNGELLILKNLIIEVYAEGISLSNTKKRLEIKPISQAISNVYKEFFLNYSESKLRYDMIEEDAGRMIVICADQYVSEMDSFLVWKRRKGVTTDLYSLSVVGSDTNSIRNFIKKQYDSLGVTFCLLVGDGDELPPPTGTVGMAAGHDADPIYAYTDGNDYYPDIFIGRFSSNGGDASNVRNQVMRSIKYERNPEEGGDWYHKGLMVASNEVDDIDSVMDKERCNWLRDTLLYNIPPYFTYTSVDSSYDPWGTYTEISSIINSGVSIINYIGHGSTLGWSSGGGFNIGSINSLTNYWKLPHVISIACLVGDFNGQTCFSEAALTAGTPENPAGFIVTLGPTISQSWVPPCVGQEGAVNLLAHYQANTAGGIYFNGLCYMIEQYGGDMSNIGVEIAQTWHIFGDPSIQLRTDTPRKFSVDKLISIFPDSLFYEITVYEEDSITTVENALVSFYSKEKSLIKSGYTNSLGNYTLELDSSYSVLDELVYMTVTGFNYEPYLDSIIVMGFVFSPESVKVNLPTEVEIISREGMEVRIDGYGFEGCDTTDEFGKAVINVNDQFGENLMVSVTDISNPRLTFSRALPVFDATDLPAPYIQAFCDTIELTGGLMPGFPGRIVGSCGLASFLAFLKGPDIDTSLSVVGDSFEYDLTVSKLGEIEIALGEVGYNIYRENFPIRNYRGWLSGYVLSGSDSIGGVELKIYNAGVDTGISSPVVVITSNDDGFYELVDSLLYGYYDVYAEGFDYQSERYTISVKNSSNNIDFNIRPEFYTFDISTLIRGSFLEVKYSIPQQTDVEFNVYNTAGRKIASKSELNDAGWFTTDINLLGCSSGVYFLVVNAGERSFPPEKFILIR
jgi:hypothetical protein